MKKIYHILFLISAFCLFSCKKWIQQQEEKAVMSAITNGYWYVYQYSKNDSDITASFSGYLFKFDANGAVTGSRDSVSEKGTWSPDITARTIYADFPSAGLPVQNLNATWKITDSYSDRVLARTTDTVANITNILELRKQ